MIKYILCLLFCWSMVAHADGYYAGRTYGTLTSNTVMGVSTFSRPVRAAAIYVHWNSTVTATLTMTNTLNSLSYLRSVTDMNGQTLVLLPTSLWLNPVSRDSLTFLQSTNVPAQITIDWEY